jgi:peptide/nickel transport system permease protein
MKWLRNLFAYIINPRARLEKLIPDEDSDEPLPPPPTVTLRQILSYPPLTLGLILVLALVFVVWFAPNLSSYDPYLITQSQRPYYDAEIKKLISPPFEMGPEYPLGTDQWGNDLMSLVLYGARVTLIAGLYITIARILLGAVLGALAGWYEETFIDRAINSLGTILGAVPILLSSIVLIYALDIHEGLWVFVVALSVLGWFETAQLVRGEVMRIKRTNYVEAAEAVGLTNLQIGVRHVLPNVLSYLIVVTALEMGAVLLLVAELAFLGVFIGGGTRYNDDPFSPRIVLLREVPEWGAMVAQGVRYIRSHPNMVLAPGFAFFISITAVNALGEGLRWMFTRWPFSTGIFLKKRSLVALGVFVLVSAVILNQTSPRASFRNVSEQIDSENVWARVEIMQMMQADNSEDSGGLISEYIASEMEDMGMVFGWRDGLRPNWHYEYETVVTPLLAEPKFMSNTRSFTYGQDFTLAPDQRMESGLFSGKLTLVNPNAEIGAEVNTDVILAPIRELILKTSTDRTSYDRVGQTIALTYEIMNNGNVPIGPAQFKIDEVLLDAPLNCGSAASSLRPTESILCTAIYTITQADLDSVSLTSNATASDGTTTSEATKVIVTRSGSAKPASSAPTPGYTIQHTVMAGDWLMQIARCYGADYESVRSFNQQIANPAMIWPGQMVSVPNVGSAGKIYGPPCVVFHTAVRSDTWESLAQQYNARVDVLRKVNPAGLFGGAIIKVPINSAGGSTSQVPTTKRIIIPSGKTSAIESGTLTAFGETTYLVAASTGQVMTVTLTPTAQEIAMGIYDPSGNMLLNPADLSLTWNGSLSSDGDYRIELVSGVGILDTNYSLEVELTPPVATLDTMADIRHGSDSSGSETLAAYNGASPLENKVAVALASQVPVNYSQFVASQGGLGLLLIADSIPLACNETANMPAVLKWMAVRENPELGILRFYTAEGEPQPLPVLLITPETGLSLLENDGLTLDIFKSGAWATRDLNMSVSINLKFGNGKAVKVHNAIGYRGGYDIDNSHETVVLFAPYDSSTRKAEDLLSPALMLEILRAWYDNHLDPRRSFMLIAWDRAGLGNPGAQAFMDEIDNYRLLTPIVPAAPVQPLMIWDLTIPSGEDDTLEISTWSNEIMAEMLDRAARDFSISTEVAEPSSCQRDISVLLPSLSLMHSKDDIPSDGSIENFGKAISLEVLEILRLPNY